MKFWSWTFQDVRLKICDGSRYLRNIRRRSARTGRRKTKQEEDERWERRKPQPRRITMDHLLGSPFLDTTDTIGYSSGPLLRPAISPDRFRSNPVISDYRWMQTLLSVSGSSFRREFFTCPRCKWDSANRKFVLISSNVCGSRNIMQIKRSKSLGARRMRKIKPILCIKETLSQLYSVFKYQLPIGLLPFLTWINLLYAEMFIVI